MSGDSADGDWVDVGPVEQFGSGSRRVVDVDGTAVLVCNINGEFLAVEDVCSHDGDELSSGDIDGDRIICPRHGARFCLRSGKALTPPAYEDIACFPLRVQQGTLQVRDDRWD